MSTSTTDTQDTVGTARLTKREARSAIATGLINRFSGQSVRVIELIRECRRPDTIASALIELEKKKEVYIERIPRTLDNKIRKDIKSPDKVFFGCFPTVRRSSLLYKTAVEYGDYTVNHILGCSHGCTYPCYAMNMSKRYGRVRSYEDWMRPRAVANTLDLLDQELPHFKDEIGFVHLSFMTDPFMYDPVNRRNIPWVQDLSLQVIKKLNSKGIRVTVLTKGIYPRILKDSDFSRENEYGITVVSLDPSFHAEYEPFSPTPMRRINALKKLSEAGLKTWVSLEPYPTSNIVKQDITVLLNRVDFVKKVIFGKWNYNPLVNGVSNSEQFYRDCSNKVVRFTQEKGISLHIKNGTPGSLEATESIFAT